MGLVDHIHPLLAVCDYSKTSTRLGFIAASFIFFSSLFLLSTCLSKLSVTYQKLAPKEKLFWHLSLVRGAYGIFGMVFGLWAIFFDEELSQDVVFATSPTSFVAITVSTGFFIFECGMLLFSDVYYKQFSVLLHIHHWLALFGCSMVMVFESTHYFGTSGMILEMSTPFSCLCWTLLKAGKAHTFLWKANQFLLVHTFHLRSVAETYFWYVTYRKWDRIWSAMPGVMFACLYTQLFLVTFIMTPYWTYKKTAQMMNPVDWNFEVHVSNEPKQVIDITKKDN